MSYLNIQLDEKVNRFSVILTMKMGLSLMGLLIENEKKYLHEYTIHADIKINNQQLARRQIQYNHPNSIYKTQRIK